MSKDEWTNVKEFDLIPPASRLAPTPKPWSTDPRAKPADFIDPDNWTDGMKKVADYAKWIAEQILDVPNLEVRFAKRMNDANLAACYSAGLLEFNMQRLGRRWFREGVSEAVDELLIHALAHHFVGSHHDKEPCPDVPSGMFYDACCVVGARLKQLALAHPH